MYVKWNDNSVGRIAAAAFPDNRKDVRVEAFRGPKCVDSYWDEGSKDEFALVDLITFRSLGLPQNHPAFSRNGRLELRELPVNTALVAGGYFRGKPKTVAVYLRPEQITPLLPADKPELTSDEQAILDIIGGIKSSYRQDEFDRRGLGRYAADHPAVGRLAAIEYVKINKIGGVMITTDGRNARKDF